MTLRLLSLLAVALLAGCDGGKPTKFENKDKGDDHHDHDRGKMKLEDITLPSGACHVGLTAHLSKKEGNSLDVAFETTDKEPKPVFLPANAKLTARVTRAGDDKPYTLTFNPAPEDERKADPKDKCSRFTAEAPWMKHEDKLDVALTVEADGQVKKVAWTDFNPKKYAHVDE